MNSLTRALAGGLALVLALAVTACGGSGSGTPSGPGASSRVLTTAITADLSPLDPDTYYEAQGLPITQATYQTLLTYAPNSPKVVPLLATSWNESSDGLTYTFTLRRGVRFSDGTPFNATAAKASFERRTALKGGPSYDTAGIKSYSTPGPNTLVIHMKTPVAPFLDYLASPYGPLMSSPTGAKRHGVRGDHGSKWFGSHSDGTGPYVLSSIKPGVVYTLTANPDYWGAKPYYTTVNFDVVPTPQQAQAELQGGQLNLVFGGELSTRELTTLAQNPSLQVQSFPALFKDAVWVNPTSSVFGQPAMRAALRAGLSNATLTKQVFGAYGTPSTNVYPNSMLPNGAAPDNPVYAPAKLKAALASYKGRPVTLGYYGGIDSQLEMAGLIQVQLQADGLNVTLRAYPPAELFNLPTSSSQRPDLMVAPFNPDAAAPDTWARIYWHKSAPVNLLGCTSAAADAALDKAAAQPNRQAAEVESIVAAKDYRDSNCWLNISDVQDPIVAQKGLAGFVHELPWVLTVQLASLHPR